MLKAKGQAEAYARDLPVEEGWPPFLIVCDVGFCFDLYADFSGTGKHYAQFPDREGFRIYLTDLRGGEVPGPATPSLACSASLDPSRKRVEVTRDIAALLAKLAKALETRHPAEHVVTFLMRCIFCMFAQSVRLFPDQNAFTALLERCRTDPVKFVGFWVSCGGR